MGKGEEIAFFLKCFKTDFWSPVGADQHLSPDPQPSLHFSPLRRVMGLGRVLLEWLGFGFFSCCFDLFCFMATSYWFSI